MNKKGFTLIEILAVIIIIGVISTIGIVAVTGNIDKSRKSTYANLARNYAESARTMRAEDKLPYDIKNDEAILIRVDALDGVRIDNDYLESPYGDLVIQRSYVIVVNDNHNYKYYVSLIDTTNHGMVNVEYSNINEDSIVADGDVTLSQISNIPSITTGSVIRAGEIDYKVNSIHEKYVILKK